MLCLLTGVLVGCGSSDTSDLQAFMDETRAKPRGSIEPLPQFRAYEPFTYAASALRSPFQAPVRIDPTVRQRGTGNIKPDVNRPKQFLEGFNIETSAWSASWPMPVAAMRWSTRRGRASRQGGRLPGTQ